MKSTNTVADMVKAKRMSDPSVITRSAASRNPSSLDIRKKFIELMTRTHEVQAADLQTAPKVTSAQPTLHGCLVSFGSSLVSLPSFDDFRCVTPERFFSIRLCPVAATITKLTSDECLRSS